MDKPIYDKVQELLSNLKKAEDELHDYCKQHGIEVMLDARCRLKLIYGAVIVKDETPKP